MKFSFPRVVSAFLLVTFAATGLTQAQVKRKSAAPVKTKPKVLVLTITKGYRHGSIPKAADAIIKLGAENGFAVDTTSDVTKLNDVNLKQYASLIFASTTGSFMNAAQKVSLQRYIQSGGGFVGIHAAADAQYDWPWYVRMVGGWFAHHPDQQMATITVTDKNNISTNMLPAEWKRKDEWYHYKNVGKDLHILLNLEESSLTYNKNGSSDKFKMGASHPIAWYHDFEGGRVFYTGLGHTDESYTEPLFLQHLLGGIKYAIGNNAPLNYGKAKVQAMPDANRFSKNSLVTGGFFEPTEMTILPNLDILVAQRRGQIMKYDHITKKISQIGYIPVYHHVVSAKDVNAEEGLLGIQIDPDFKTNNYLYMYYSPVDSNVNRLSRFTYRNNKIDQTTEKVILEVKTTREICCHTGGSIAFGKDRIMYISQGDNTTPFDEPMPKGKKLPNTYSYAPLDDRPGFEQYDEGRSAGNTNDLRGKIMRIKMNLDGTYSIPEGNLFPKGTDKTRPEIYVMGNRNPYRISVDKKSGFLYWGEVGPDASNDSLATHGPRGYDEVNQAKKAGNFGWPFLIGNNIPYRSYDYATGKYGEPFDKNKPLNNSRNNTGLKELPAGTPAFIWYPYADSPEFPEVGSGGRTAMAGPVYHSEDHPSAVGKLPAYYDNKLFIYDFVRGWIKVVTMDENGDLEYMEPFMKGTQFNSMIDMEMGPDGKLYVLEYGTGWFSENKDSGLTRIEYNAGNRAPEISAVAANMTYGTLPLTVTLTAKATDPEKDKITYVWDLGNGIKKTTLVPKLSYTYTKEGTYDVTVVAKDSKLATSKPSKKLQIAAGSADEPVDPSLPFADGKALMLTLDCKVCHKTDEVSVGPSFTAVANKYDKNDKTFKTLGEKIINGGTGVWGDVVMPAHPSLKPEETKKILNWIMSLKK
ncbi:ThuA domain-containing protein [Mucilaginibacter myungsuensis]|uniref:ThuA domain-containing protein n=1 Tax=Mucilaginibacter myungsuensis TaxID=649104 RepID=A0A929KT63_9SPHI|nr:ThuA domain-containing protein [Mucilaginibacter myungsuensis]MBE9661089.1 ThuA domain-containing protein [Mucilaginibacter myungsuensis]MDN3597233.1 ThuA domain-containing protein [Mucilaginibacter myungsuensis]